MLILLPPSESKEFGTSKTKLNFSKLSFPSLSHARQTVAASLIKLSQTPKKATEILGISSKQLAELEANQNLLTAKCSPAIEIYNGVLFDAFDYQNLSTNAKKMADKSVLITSALFGMLSTQDAIPHYRLSGSVSLPKIGSFQKVWQQLTEETLVSQNPDLVVDMRSGTYAKFWQPTDTLISKTVVIKIMSRVGKGKSAKKIAISHNNKHTKGLIARDLVSLKTQPKNQAQLLKSLESLGYEVEVFSNPRKPDLFEVFI